MTNKKKEVNQPVIAHKQFSHSIKNTANHQYNKIN
jgi:hypothetical protein